MVCRTETMTGKVLGLLQKSTVGKLISKDFPAVFQKGGG